MNLKQKIKDYTPILKEDKDFDYSYILIMLIFKLKRTREHIVSHNVHENSKNIGLEIKKVEDLLNNVLEDNYYNKLEKKIIEKYGKIKKKKIALIKKDKNLFEIKFYREKETNKNAEEIRKEELNAYRKAAKMRSDDLKKAFDIMHKKMFGWWD